MGVEINYLQKRHFLLTTHALAEENLLHFSANTGVNGNLFTNQMNPKGNLSNKSSSSPPPPFKIIAEAIDLMPVTNVHADNTARIIFVRNSPLPMLQFRS